MHQVAASTTVRLGAQPETQSVSVGRPLHPVQPHTHLHRYLEHTSTAASPSIIRPSKQRERKWLTLRRSSVCCVSMTR